MSEMSAGQVEAAVSEIKALIRARFPEAKFEVVDGDDPEGVYLIATVDVADTDEVVDCYVDRLLELQVEDEMPLYVVPVRPLDRILASRSEQPSYPSAMISLSD